MMKMAWQYGASKIPTEKATSEARHRGNDHRPSMRISEIRTEKKRCEATDGDLMIDGDFMT